MLYVYVILLFTSSALPGSVPSLYALQARKGKTFHTKARPCQNSLFLSEVLNITHHVFKTKYQVYNNSVIALLQTFSCVCTNRCIPDEPYRDASVRAYTNKGLNKCDDP